MIRKGSISFSNINITPTILSLLCLFAAYAHADCTPEEKAEMILAGLTASQVMNICGDEARESITQQESASGAPNEHGNITINIHNENTQQIDGQTASSTREARPDRSGFYLSAALGLQNTSFSEGASDGGGHFSYKIGGHTGPRSALYWTGNGSMGELENRSYTSALLGIGWTYWFSHDLGSPYLELAAGFGFASIEASTETFFHEEGGGFLVGAGYEFAKHIQSGISIKGISTDHSDVSTVTWKLELKL